MKKLLLLTAILALTLCSQNYSQAAENKAENLFPQKQFTKPCNGQFHKPPMRPDKATFEKRLKLTEDQKLKAKEIHQRGFEEIKPTMEKIKLKHEEIESVKRSSLTPEAQAEKIVQLRKELKELKTQARGVQMKNMKEFEGILTDKQKKELKKIKEEGRKNFERNHKKQMFKVPPMPPKHNVGCPKEPPVVKPVLEEK